MPGAPLHTINAGAMSPQVFVRVRTDVPIVPMDFQGVESDPFDGQCIEWVILARVHGMPRVPCCGICRNSP